MCSGVKCDIQRTSTSWLALALIGVPWDQDSLASRLPNRGSLEFVRRVEDPTGRDCGGTYDDVPFVSGSLAVADFTYEEPSRPSSVHTKARWWR
jgi:hypothetical protein